MKETNNLYTALRRIRKYRPIDPEEFRAIGVPLNKEPIGEGAFRSVHKMKRIPCVVKFCLSESDGFWPQSRDSKMHTTAEVNRIKRLSKYPILRTHLPRVYWHDRESGVLVMKYYDEVPVKGDTVSQDMFYATTKGFKKLFKKIGGVELGDISPWNTGVDKRRRNGLEFINLVFLDLGY